jgi:hypothetical protein
MFKRNQFSTTIIFASVTLASFATFAQQTEPSVATVTVQNAFVLTETAALSFGTITASYDSGAATSSIILSPDGTQVADGDQQIKSLSNGTPAAYTITGAASFTNLKANLNKDTVELKNQNAPTTDPFFTLDTFTIQAVGATEAKITSAALSETTALVTNAQGEVTFSLGGTLSLPGGGTFTDAGTTKTLVDGDYTGTYSITVSY